MQQRFINKYITIKSQQVKSLTDLFTYMGANQFLMEFPVKFLFQDHFMLERKKHKVAVTLIAIDELHNYYYCVVDDTNAMNIALSTDNHWIDLTAGKTMYAKAIGELIERRHRHTVTTHRYHLSVK